MGLGLGPCLGQIHSTHLCCCSSCPVGVDGFWGDNETNSGQGENGSSSTRTPKGSQSPRASGHSPLCSCPLRPGQQTLGACFSSPSSRRQMESGHRLRTALHREPSRAVTQCASTSPCCSCFCCSAGGGRGHLYCKRTSKVPFSNSAAAS